MRCQFIHDISEAQQPEVAPQQAQPAYTKLASVSDTPKLPEKKAAGGFGNKQASAAFAATKIIYRDILAHNLNVSV